MAYGKRTCAGTKRGESQRQKSSRKVGLQPPWGKGLKKVPPIIGASGIGLTKALCCAKMLV